MKYTNRICVLSRIPRNMLKLHGIDNMSEFVLHDLCCKDCFNLQKAAYFVDNPAFDCLKGVAGYNQDEAYCTPSSIWEDKESFCNYMQAASFNQKVRTCVQYSCKNCDNPDEAIMNALAEQLGMNEFQYCTWDMKHDNHGYLIYQPNEQEMELDDLVNGLSLLGFCPIF